MIHELALARAVHATISLLTYKQARASHPLYGESQLRAPAGDSAGSWKPPDPRKPASSYFSRQSPAYIRYEGTARNKEQLTMSLRHERVRALVAQWSSKETTR